jgi:hypothetical protein
MSDKIAPRTAYEGAGGWKDGRFGQAYDLIADALKERGVEIGRHKLLEAIEAEDDNYDPS